MNPIVYPVPHLPMLGKGSILLDVFDATGAHTGFQHLGNCTKMELQIKDDIAELFQSLNKASSMIASALKKRTPMLAITGTDFSSKHMAIAMMGDLVPLVGTVQTVTAEPLASATATKKGKYFFTANRNLDVSIPANTVVHQAATALVQGTDYIIVDPVTGCIYFPLTSAVVDATAVTIDYVTLAVTLDQVNAATKPFINGALKFIPDPTDGQKIAVDVWRFHMNPTGGTGLIADDYGNWSVDARILDDSANHPTCPYFQQTFIP
jgi:hypothetical protein